MPQPLPAPKVFRFGPFEFDPRSGHLRSESATQCLADQPLALLNALLERPGEMVSREELRHKLWPDGTFVDFDHGLNSAVSRLREALNDSANTPRFIQTIPRRGYRLLAPVEADRAPVADDVAPAEPLPADDAPSDAARPVVPEPARVWRPRRRALAWTGMVATCLVLVGVAAVFRLGRDARPASLLARVVIDLPDEWQILNESPAISPDSRHIVFSAWHSRAGRRAIWHRLLETSAARMLPGTDDGSAPFWSPDGQSIGFFAEGKLKVLQLAGNAARVVCDAPRLRAGRGSDLMSSCSHPGRPGLSPRSTSKTAPSDTSRRWIPRRANGSTSGRRHCPMAVTSSTSQTARTSSLRRWHRSTERAPCHSGRCGLTSWPPRRGTRCSYGMERFWRSGSMLPRGA